jgi:glyoxylase-like metal-dependent hydrolase (beta-lactamase superfamily II)
MQVPERIHIVGRGSWGGHEPLSGEGDCNVFLIDGTTELALVDVGIGPNFDRVWHNIKSAGFGPAKVTSVLLTHTHWDHAGALPGLRRRSRATVFAHPLSAQAVRTLHPHLGAGPAAKLLGPARARKLFHVDRTVREGDRLRVGDLTLQVLELAGHTPECLGWLLTLKGKRFLFSGDAALGDQGKTRGNIGWLDVHWGSSLPAYARTLRRLSRMKFDGLLPGHGLPILGRTRVTQSLRHCRERLEKFRRFPQLGSMLPLSP